MGLLLRVYSTDIGPGTGAPVRLGQLPEYAGCTTQQEHNQPGSISFSYPKTGRSADLLNLVDAFIVPVEGGVERTDWYLLEDDGDEPAHDGGPVRPVQVAGRGALAILERANVGVMDPLDPKSATKRSFEATPGAIMATLLAEAKARGVAGFTTLTWDFTATKDSAGQTWESTRAVTYEATLNLLAIITAMADNGWCDIRMERAVLRMYNPKTAAGVDRPDVILRVGKEVTGGPRKRSRRSIRTHLLGVGDEGVHVDVADTSTAAQYGRREGSFTYGGITNPATLLAATQAELDQVKNVAEGFTVEFVPDPGRGIDPIVPGVDFNLGDFVRYDQRRLSPTELEPLRVRSIAMQYEDRGALATISAELNDLFTESVVRLKRKVDGIVNGATSGVGSAPTPPPPGVDLISPNAPTGITVSAQTYIGSDGFMRDIAAVNWLAPFYNTDGTVADDIDSYQVEKQTDGQVDYDAPTTVAPATPDTLARAPFLRRNQGTDGWLNGQGGGNVSDSLGREWFLWGHTRWGKSTAAGAVVRQWEIANSVTRRHSAVTGPEWFGYAGVDNTLSLAHARCSSTAGWVKTNCTLAVKTSAPEPAASSAYQEAVLADSPVAYFAVDGTTTTDLSGNGHTLTYPAGASTSTMPNGESVAVFNGTTQYAQIADAPDLSVPNTGTLTVEAWVRPDTLDMPGAQSSGDGPMCHFIGKGDTANSSQEYAFRFYNKTGSSRPNRFSAYHFPADGGLGAGSYFQGGINSTDGGTPPVLAAGDWVHVTAVYDTTTLVNGYGTVKIYRNGVLMDHDNMSDYSTTPVDGVSPLRVATRDLLSFFKGAIGHVAVYDHAVPQPRLAAHYTAMMEGPSPAPTPAPSDAGSDSLQMTRSSAGRMIARTDYPAAAGQVWRAMATFDTTATAADQRLYVQFVSAKGALLSEQFGTPSATTGRASVLSLTSPTGTSKVRFAVVGNAAGAAGQTVRFTQPALYRQSHELASWRLPQPTFTKTNLVPDPGFRVAAAPAEVRRNLMLNPSSLTGAWPSSDPAKYVTTLDASKFRSGGKSTRGESQAANTTSTVASFDGGPVVNTIAVASTDVVTSSTYLYTDEPGRKGRASMRWYAGTTPGAVVSGALVDLAPGQWTRVSVTATTPSTGSVTAVLPVAAVVTADGSVPAMGEVLTADPGGEVTATVVGEYAWADDWLVEKAGAALPYFDGSTAATADGATYGWSGAGATGTSIMFLPAQTGPVARYTPTSGVVGGRVLVDGEYAHRVIAKTGTVLGALLAFGASGYATATAGEQWKARLQARLVGGAQDLSINARLGFYSGAGANIGLTAANVYTLPSDGRWVDVVIADPVAAPATSASARFLVYAGTTMPAGATIEFRRALAEKGTGWPYPYFDGSTATTDGAGGGGNTFAWSGAANASSSVGTFDNREHQGTTDSATSLFSPADAGGDVGEYAKDGDIFATGSSTYAFYQGFYRDPVTGGESLTGRVYLAEWVNDRLIRTGLWISDQKTVWGNAVRIEQSHVYIVGSQSGAAPGGGFDNVLMRVPVSDVWGAAKQYWKGGTWGTTATSPTVILSGTDAPLTGLHKVGGTWWVLWASKSARHIYQASAANIEGPYGSPGEVYRYPVSPTVVSDPRFVPHWDTNRDGVAMVYSQRSSAVAVRNGQQVAVTSAEVSDVTRGAPVFLRGPDGVVIAGTPGTRWGDRQVVNDLTAVYDDLVPGQQVAFRVRAVDYSGNVSMWNTSAQMLLPTDAVPPAQPSPPVVEDQFRGVRVRWDGLDVQGGPMPPDYLGYSVHLSTDEAFDPTADTLVDAQRGRGGVTPVSGLEYGVTYYARIVAYDTNGNASTPSDAVGVTTVQLSDADLPDKLITGAKVATESISVRNLTVGAFADNLLPNGNFEDVDTDDPTMPYGWRGTWWEGAGNASMISRDTSTPISGAASLRVTANATDSIEVVSRTIPLTPGDIYYISFKVRTSRAVAGGLIQSRLWASLSEDKIGALFDPEAPVLPGPIGSTTDATTVHTVEGSFTVPAGGFRFGALGLWAHADPVGGDYAAWFDDVELRKIVGTAAIANASINRAKIADLAVDDAKIASASIGKLITGILNGDMILGARIISGPSGGTHAEMTSTGFRAYVEDPNDGVPNEAVRMGTDGDTFAVINPITGDALAAISQEGVVSAQTLEIGEATVQGEPLVGPTLLTGILAGVQAGENRDSILTAMPMGVIQYGVLDAPSNPTNNTTGVGVIEILAPIFEGRLYRICTNQVRVRSTVANVGAELRVVATYGPWGDRDAVPAAPVVSGDIVMRCPITNIDQATGEPLSINALWTSGGRPGGGYPGTFIYNVRFLLTVAKVSGSTANIYADGSTLDPIQFWLEDVGPLPDNAGQASSGSGGLTGSPIAPPATTPKATTVKTLSSTSSGTYNGSGTKLAKSDVVQGYSSANGDASGLWIMPSMTGYLSGATVNKIEVYLYATHWYYNSGGTALIRAHGYSSAPGSGPSTVYIVGSAKWPKPGGRWVKIPNSTIVFNGVSSTVYDHVKAGRIKGFGVGPSGTTNLLYYGRFRGSAQVRLTYTK